MAVATVVAVEAAVAVLEERMWVCGRKCRSYRNCRDFRRIGIRHCTRSVPAVPSFRLKGEVPPPRRFAQDYRSRGIRAWEVPPSRCRRPCRDKSAYPAVGAAVADGAALVAVVAKAAAAALAELEAEGERIRRNRSCCH